MFFRQEPQELRQDRQISSRQPGALSQSPCCPTCRLLRLLLGLLYHAALIQGSVSLSLIAVLSVSLPRPTTTRTLSVKRATPITPPPAPICSPPPLLLPLHLATGSAGRQLQGSGQSEMKHGSKLKLSLGYIFFPCFLARQFLCTRTGKVHTHQHTLSPSRSFLSRPSDPSGTLILPRRHRNPLMSPFLSLVPLLTFFLCKALLCFCLKDTINYLFLEQTHWSFSCSCHLKVICGDSVGSTANLPRTNV